MPHEVTPGNVQCYLPPYKAIAVLLAMAPALYVTPPRLIYFTTGSLHLSFPFTFRPFPPPHPQRATIGVLSASVSLSLFGLFIYSVL